MKVGGFVEAGQCRFGERGHPAAFEGRPGDAAGSLTGPGRIEADEGFGHCQNRWQRLPWNGVSMLMPPRSSAYWGKYKTQHGAGRFDLQQAWGVSRIRPALSHLVSHPKTFGRAQRCLTRTGRS